MKFRWPIRINRRWRARCWYLVSVVIEVIDLLVSIAILALACPLYLTLVTLRTLALIAAKLRFGMDTTLLDNIDVFAIVESLQSYIHMVLEADGRIELKQLEDRIKQNLTDLRGRDGRYRHPKLRSYVDVFLGYGVYRWEEDFDICRHVLPVVDPKSGKTRVFTSRKELFDYTQLMTDKTYMPLPPKTSPWRIHLMYYKEPSAAVASSSIDLDDSAVKSVLVVEVPHTMSDGYSTANVFTDALLDRSFSDLFTERKLSPSAAPKMSVLQGLLLRLSGILRMFSVIGFVRTRKEYKNPYDSTRATRRATVRDWGKDPTLERTIFTARPLIIPIEILWNIKDATGVSTLGIVICAYLRAIAKYWIQERLPPGESHHVWSQWTFSGVIPVSLWDPDAPLQLANNVAVCRPLFECSQFMDNNLHNALTYVQKHFFSEAVKTAWVIWAFENLVIRNLPKPLLEIHGKLTHNFPMTASVQMLRLSPGWKGMTLFGQNLTIIGFMPNVTPFQDLGSGVAFYDKIMAAFALFASSMVIDSQQGVLDMLKMVKEEILNMHATLVPSKSINFDEKVKALIPPHAFFLGRGDLLETNQLSGFPA